MTLLREWASGFCAAGVACALLSALCPKGAVRQAFGMLTALLMLCALLSPVDTLLQTLSDGFVVPLAEETASATLSETTLKQAMTVIENAVYADALERLDDAPVTLKRVRVLRDTRDESCIYIKSVRLVFDKTDRPVDDRWPRMLSMAWGVPTEVYYEDES